MQTDPLYHRLLEESWRRKLTLAEEAELRQWLAAHPEVQAEWEAEVALNEALTHLPEAPVPSNFTARILQSIERDNMARIPIAGWSPLRWLPRVAFGALVITAGFGSYRWEVARVQRDEYARQLEYAQSVEVVSDVTSLASPEILQNFEAIGTLNQAPVADRQLLTLLQ